MEPTLDPSASPSVLLLDEGSHHVPSHPVTPPEARPSAVGADELGTWHVTDAEHLAELRRAVTAAAGPDGDVLGRPAKDRLLLVVNELATNGLKYGAPPVRVSLRRVREGWLVDIRDGRAELPPVLQPSADARPGGHGLRIVARVSTAWGWYREEGRAGAPGKHVWAHVPAEPLARVPASGSAAR